MVKGGAQMFITVRKIDAVRGFMPTSYAVFAGKYIAKIFLRKADAERFAEECRGRDAADITAEIEAEIGAAGAVRNEKSR